MRDYQDLPGTPDMGCHLVRQEYLDHDLSGLVMALALLSSLALVYLVLDLAMVLKTSMVLYLLVLETPRDLGLPMNLYVLMLLYLLMVRV